MPAYKWDELPEDEFWKMVDIRGPQDCWPWRGRTKAGYGRVSFYSRRTGKTPRTQQAHRVAWEFVNGPIEDASLEVCHTCDNPPCCNTAHHFLGTQSDNARDMQAKGRGRGGSMPGSANPSARLTEAQIMAIRKDGRSQRLIGIEYGVTKTMIRMIQKRKAWSHVS